MKRQECEQLTLFQEASPLGDKDAAKRRIEEAQAQARLAWNTRAPILSAEEMEMLDAKD